MICFQAKNCNSKYSKPPCHALAPLRMKQGEGGSFYFFCHKDGL